MSKGAGMRDFSIAMVQQRSPVGKKQQNLEAALAWTRKAARKGAQLVVFPELNVTGHAGHPSMIEDAEAVPDGDACRAVTAAAAELGIYICCGIAEAERGVHYNTQFLVGPGGFIGKQRKLHLSGDEYFYFRSGRLIPVLETELARLGIVICFDNAFPEVSRVLAVKGAEVVLAVHAARFGRWPRDAKGRRRRVKELKEGWLMTQRARAHDNATYVALVNAVGRSAEGIKDVEANHAGGAMLIGPDGDLSAESRGRDITEEMLLARVEAAAVKRRREGKCFNLRVRRPECFGALAEPTG